MQGGWAGVLDADGSDEDDEDGDESDGFAPSGDSGSEASGSESEDASLIDEDGEDVRAARFRSTCSFVLFCSAPFDLEMCSSLPATLLCSCNAGRPCMADSHAGGRHPCGGGVFLISDSSG